MFTRIRDQFCLQIEDEDPIPLHSVLCSLLDGGGIRRLKREWEIQRPNAYCLSCRLNRLISFFFRINSTLEATQGQILTQYPTDATTGRWHLNRS